MNRRDFVRISAAGLSLAAIGPSALAATAGGPRISAVLYDDRFEASKAFAAALQLRGALPFAVRDDPMGLWYGDLGALLRRDAGWVAGLTRYSDFVIARSCGRELALRPIVATCGSILLPARVSQYRSQPVDESDRAGPVGHQARLTRWLLGPRSRPDGPPNG
jgi:hypothetical protein